MATAGAYAPKRGAPPRRFGGVFVCAFLCPMYNWRMDSKNWKILAAFCFFSARQLLRGMGATALLMAFVNNPLQRIGVGIACFIAAHYLRLEFCIRDLMIKPPVPNSESPPDHS